MNNLWLQFLQGMRGKPQKDGVLDLQTFTQLAKEKLKNIPPQGYVIVGFDVDRFVALQSRYGRARGEALLCELADVLLKKKQKQSLFARVQDKFILMVSPHTTASFLDRLQQDLADAVKTIGLEKYIGTVNFSFGVYIVKQGQAQETIESVLDKVYVAHKTAAKSKDKILVTYDAALLQAIEQENYYNEHFRDALAKNEFKVYLQRQVVLAQPEKLCARALVRWALPNGRLVYPGAFIPQFEKNGMMMYLDFYVIEQVCIYLQTMRGDGGSDAVISVSVSPITLFQPDFVTQFLSIVARYQVSPKSLVIEIQKPFLIEDEPTALEKLTDLNKQGFALTTEISPSGQTNFRLLVELPIRYLKINRELIRAADTNVRMGQVMAQIIQLAHGLSLQVICEGVEHPTDVTLLQRLGCDIAQGYHLMRAVPMEQFLDAAQQAMPTLQEKLQNGADINNET